MYIDLNHFITINASTTNTSNDVVLYSAYGFHITGTPKQRLTINGTDMRLIYAAFGPVVVDNVVYLDAEQTITSWGETNLTTKCAVQLKGSDDALTVNGADVYIKTSGSSLFKATNRTNANLSLIRADIISGAMDGTSLNISNDVNRYILHYSNADLEDICPVYGGFGFHIRERSLPLRLARKRDISSYSGPMASPTTRGSSPCRSIISISTRL